MGRALTSEAIGLIMKTVLIVMMDFHHMYGILMGVNEPMIRTVLNMNHIA